MADITTTFMGIKLASPVVVGACSLSKVVDKIKEAEDLGAGGLVIKSLFEEQIDLEQAELQDALQAGADLYAESPSFFPELTHAGPEQHLFWVEKTRKATKLPLFASLNATGTGTWVEWAKKLEETGVDGLELNLFALGSRADKRAEDLESELFQVVETVADKVKIPVSIKLAPFYTSLASVAAKLETLGAQGLVLFNRFAQPDIDIQTQKIVQHLRLSSPEEAMLTLRWVGLLNGQGKADLVAATGIHDAETVVKMLLAGAKAVQVVSALYVNGVSHLKRLNEGLAAWMDEHGYNTIEDFRGKLSQTRAADPYAYERAQYIKLLLGFD